MWFVPFRARWRKTNKRRDYGMTPRLRAVAWFAAVLLPSGLPAADVIPLVVRDGRCSCVIADSCVLVVGSLARDAGPFRVSVTSEITDAPVALPRAAAARDLEWVGRTGELRGRLDRARQVGAALEQFPASPQPARERTFYLFVGGGDLSDPAGYAAIRGALRSVGRSCQVYVDGDEPLSTALQAT